MQYKLRKIMDSKSSGQVVRGLTCPEEISMFFSGCFFDIEKSGTAIIYSSGTSIIPTQSQIENYKFENAGSVLK